MGHFHPLPMKPDQAADRRTAAIALIGEAVVEVLGDRMAASGAPFNVACNLAALGSDPFLISRIGMDSYGDFIVEQCKRFGLDSSAIARDSRLPTGVVNVRMNGTVPRREFAQGQAWDEIDASSGVNEMVSRRPGIVYFDTLCQRSPVSRHAVRAAINARLCTRFLDVNLRGQPSDRAVVAESLAMANIVKADEDELAQLIGWFVRAMDTEPPFVSAGHEADVVLLMDRFELDALYVTRASKGAVAYRRGAGLVAAVEPQPVAVVDTDGAGDAFCAALLHGHVNGWTLRRSLRRAASFASAVCGFAGAVSSDLGFYEKQVCAWNQDPQEERNQE